MRIRARNLIEHPGNDGRYSSKAIYNELSALRGHGMVATDYRDGELITASGKDELRRLNLMIGIE